MATVVCSAVLFRLRIDHLAATQRVTPSLPAGNPPVDIRSHDSQRRADYQKDGQQGSTCRPDRRHLS